MIRFNNDYSESCHEAVLNYIATRSTEQNPGYGTDDYCARATELIKKKCGNDQLSVHFLTGGTQANLIMIAAALRPHHGIIAVDSAHIHVHETGAIEATGHKILAIHSEDGKIAAKAVENEVLLHRNNPDAEHVVKPKMVYISNPTEYGTLYSKSELQALCAVCRKYGLWLYLDGARLGYGLTAEENDLQFADLAELCDAFYIGGTKVGALFGEAMVICNPVLAEDFRYIVKQRGGMLAKGWLLGMQFCALFEDDLYFKISAHANKMADKIRTCITQLGYKLFLPGSTNQVFAVLPDPLLSKLSKKISYCYWNKYDEGCSVIRLCTSWATRESDVQALCEEIIRLSGEGW